MTPEEFKAAIYAGGANDKVATDRGIEILTEMGMSPEEGLAFWNQALGTQLTNDDMTGALAARVPENFEDYIYAGGANDMIATDRGIDLLEQHKIPFDEALGLWNEALGTDFDEDVANVAIAVRDPDAFEKYIYSGGADDKLATDRGIKALIDHKIPVDRALALWNQALGTSFTLSDANRSLQERYMPVISEADVLSPYTSYLKGDNGAIVGNAGRASTQDNRGLQTIGNNGPQNFFSFDAPYSSSLIKSLRQTTPNAGNMNSGVTMRDNEQTATGGGLAVTPPPSGLSNNVQQAPPPQDYVPPTQGEEDRDGVDDSGGNDSQQVLNSGYSNTYFQANPDVAKMYESNFKDSMTPDAYALEHWLNYGQTEGRDGWKGPAVRPGELIFGSGNGDVYASQGN